MTLVVKHAQAILFLVRTWYGHKMPDRLSETLAKRAKPPLRGSRITYDSDIKGFGLRITPNGAKSFILNYRVNGRERRITLGRYPAWSAAAARKRAAELKQQVDRGVDPLAKKQEERDAPSMSDLCADYREKHLPMKRPSSQRHDRSAIDKIILPRLGRMKVAAVSYADIEALHRDLSRTAPFQANRVVALLSKMFSLAIKWGMATENPAKGIHRNPENPRQRYLDRAELDRLAIALDAHPNQIIADAVRLLLLTGARKMEVLAATWDQFDLEAGVWTKPAASVKQARLHRVPLSSAAIAVLRGLARSSSPHFLFRSPTAERPLGDIKKSWELIRSAAGLAGLRLHDLRHTYAAHLVSGGSSLPLIGALLGHTQPQTTARYAHLMDDPMRQATEKIGKILSERIASRDVDPAAS